jgi:hypothetical protein
MVKLIDCKHGWDQMVRNDGVCLQMRVVSNGLTHGRVVKHIVGQVACLRKKKVGLLGRTNDRTRLVGHDIKKNRDVGPRTFSFRIVVAKCSRSCKRCFCDVTQGKHTPNS